jgi:hypothetical protein
MKTYLDVEFSDKDKVKALGARFDMASKRWFVPDGLDLIPFLKWVPRMPYLSRGVRKTLHLPKKHGPQGHRE